MLGFLIGPLFLESSSLRILVLHFVECGTFASLHSWPSSYVTGEDVEVGKDGGGVGLVGHN